MDVEAVYLTHQFAAEAKLFCKLLDDLEEPDQLRFLAAVAGVAARLIDLAIQLPETEPASELATPDQETSQLASKLADFIGDLSIHQQIFNPIAEPASDEAEVVAMSLADDLLDVYGHLREGLLHYQQGHLAGAVWCWRYWFFAHWGRHATSALRAIVWRLAEATT